MRPYKKMIYLKQVINSRKAGPVKVAIISMICFAVVAHAAVNILQTDAADAFKAGDYERAVTEYPPNSSSTYPQLTIAFRFERFTKP